MRRRERQARRRRFGPGLLVAALLLGWAAPAAAGPWTKDPGELYVKLGQGFFVADSFRDASGNLQDGVAYLGATTSIYGEVGLLPGLHLWGYLPYVVARNSVAEDGSSWLRASGGDALLGLQFTPRFLKLPLPAALKLEIKVPLYDVNGVQGLYGARFPAPGDGQIDVTLWLSAGAGNLGGLPLYVYGELGYRFRTEAFVGTGPFSAQFVDGLTFFASAGYTLAGRVLLAVNSGGVIPLEQDGYSKGYVTLGPALYVPLWRGLAAEASFDPMIYTNANASPGLGMSLGLSFKH